MKMTGFERLDNYQAVVSHFGGWPSFHDAEVLRIAIDRAPDEGEREPTVEIAIHAFNMTDTITDSGRLQLRDHATVTLAFFDVVDISLEGFNQQNALMGVAIRDMSGHQLEDVTLELKLTAAFGVDVSFRCRTGCVRNVVAGIPPGS